MEKLIKTSKGELVRNYKCRIKGCKIQTREYVKFGGFMLPICKKHKEYVEKIKEKEKIEENKKSIKDIDFSKALKLD
jgi:hypothetical protein